MNQPSLPTEDLPPTPITQADEILRRKLEEAIAKYFYEACDGVTQAVLSRCEWYITTKASALTLAIACQDTATTERIQNYLVSLGQQLQWFSVEARIRIYPPGEGEEAIEISVSEVCFSQDSL